MAYTWQSFLSLVLNSYIEVGASTVKSSSNFLTTPTEEPKLNHWVNTHLKKTSDLIWALQ